MLNNHLNEENEIQFEDIEISSNPELTLNHDQIKPSKLRLILNILFSCFKTSSSHVLYDHVQTDHQSDSSDDEINYSLNNRNSLQKTKKSQKTKIIQLNHKNRRSNNSTPLNSSDDEEQLELDSIPEDSTVEYDDFERREEKKSHFSSLDHENFTKKEPTTAIIISTPSITLKPLTSSESEEESNDSSDSDSKQNENENETKNNFESKLKSKSDESESDSDSNSESDSFNDDDKIILSLENITLINTFLLKIIDKLKSLNDIKNEYEKSIRRTDNKTNLQDKISRVNQLINWHQLNKKRISDFQKLYLEKSSKMKNKDLFLSHPIEDFLNEYQDFIENGKDTIFLRDSSNNSVFLPDLPHLPYFLD